MYQLYIFCGAQETFCDCQRRKTEVPSRNGITHHLTNPRIFLSVWHLLTLDSEGIHSAGSSILRNIYLYSRHSIVFFLRAQFTRALLWSSSSAEPNTERAKGKTPSEIYKYSWSLPSRVSAPSLFLNGLFSSIFI